LGFISFDHAGSYSSGGSYSANGWLLSSAYNLSQPSKIQVIEWTGMVGAGTSLKFQARAAADKNGSPGKWGAWYGATGVGTYFTLADGSLISTDLNGQQWLQYRVELSGDGSATPILNKVKINYK
jgi:hypothetical protein